MNKGVLGNILGHILCDKEIPDDGIVKSIISHQPSTEDFMLFDDGSGIQFDNNDVIIW